MAIVIDNSNLYRYTAACSSLLPAQKPAQNELQNTPMSEIFGLSGGVDPHARSKTHGLGAGGIVTLRQHLHLARWSGGG